MAIFGAGIATYIPISDGNVDAGASWALVDTVSENDTLGTSNGNTYIDNTTGTASTTSYQKSGTWTYASSPPTIDGIAYRILSKTAGGGTITVALDIANADVTGTIVTCNVSDLPNNGWVLFKFASPVTLTTATYSIKFKTSVTGTVTIKSDGSTAHCRLLRTTTTGTAPQNGASQNDNMYIMGEITGAGAVTTRTMTWNITSNTNPFNRIVIGGNAVVNLQNSASTNYYMRMRNDNSIYDTGVLNIGTSGTPVQSTSSFTFTMASATTTCISFLVNRGGALNVYGATKGTFRTDLTANVAVSGTTINVGAVTNWANGDKLAIGTTTVTQTQCEETTISSISGNTVTVPALSFAHSGTAPKIAEVVNLSRNVIFQGVDDTHHFNIVGFSGSTILMRYAEMTFMGANNTIFGAIYANTDTSLGGSIDIQYCSIHDCGSFAYGLILGTCNGTLTFSNNVTFSISNTHVLTPTTNTYTGTMTFNNNTFIYMPVSGCIVTWGFAGTNGTNTFTNNTLVGASGAAIATKGGIEIIGNGNVNTTMTGNVIHGGPGYAVTVNPTLTTNFTFASGSWTVWCMGYGYVIVSEILVGNVSVDGFTSYSNSFTHFLFSNSFVGPLGFNNLQLQAGTTTVCPIGIQFSPSGNFQAIGGLVITNSNIGDTQAHTTADFSIAAKPTYVNVNMLNTKLGSTTAVSGLSNITFGGLASDRHQQTANNFATWTSTGAITRDTTIYDAASPSIRVTPSSASLKVNAGQIVVAVNDSQTPTVSVRVRKSKTSSGDAATYNGNQPRLMLAASINASVSAQVLATATSASDGAWETLTATLPAPSGNGLLTIYVDCDGTAGWINIDTATTTALSTDPGNMDYVNNGQPLANIGTGTTVNITTYVPIPITRKKVI